MRVRSGAVWGGDTNFIKRPEESWVYAPFNTEHEDMTMRSAKFRKCAKRTKQNLASTRFGLKSDFAMGMMKCVIPVHVLRSISLLSHTLNQVICNYLLKKFAVILHWMALFTFSIQGLARFIENGPSAFCNVPLNQTSNNGPSRVS